MITPRFSCSQTAIALIVRIYVPAVRASDVELHVDGTLFSVHIAPYFLRLVFPGELIEDDSSSAAYDPASGYLTVTLTKATPGEDFKDLDVLARLLAPPKRDEPAHQAIIEVMGSQSIDEELLHEVDIAATPTEQLTFDEQELLQASENDWHIPQEIPHDDLISSAHVSTQQFYGFLDAYTGYFKHVTLSENDVNELGADTEKLSGTERRTIRIKHEDEKWDEEHYMADYMDDEYIQEIMAFEFSLEAPYSRTPTNPLIFTEEENMAMLQLPRKEYLAPTVQKHNLYLALLNILFSHAYDARTTQHDPTPESAWTICILTPAFAALDPPPYAASVGGLFSFTSADLQNTLAPSIRRSLAFPLFRNFALARKCIQDVSVVLRHGRRTVLRALLEIKKILDRHEVYYIYSKIWVDDFCRWVASDASEEILLDLGQKLVDLSIDKRSLGWDLLELEATAQQQLEREPDSDDASSSSRAQSDSEAGPLSSSASSTGSDSSASESSSLSELTSGSSDSRST